MDASEAAKVPIAGGGIAVRRAPALRNISWLTLERRGTPEDGGLAIDLPGNAVHALAQLGLADALQEVGPRSDRATYAPLRDPVITGSARHPHPTPSS